MPPAPVASAPAAATPPPDTAAHPDADATAAAATMAAATAMTTAATAGDLDAAAQVFPVEQIERGETDVGHFLFAENQALIGRDVV